jgi:hypothetical protein
VSDQEPPGEPPQWKRLDEPQSPTPALAPAWPPPPPTYGPPPPTSYGPPPPNGYASPAQQPTPWPQQPPVWPQQPPAWAPIAPARSGGRGRLIAIVAAAVVVVLCIGFGAYALTRPKHHANSATAASGVNSGPSTVTVSGGSGSQRTAVQLTAVLMTAEDISESGWAASSFDDGTDDSSDDDPCDPSDATLSDPAHNAQASFSQGQTGPFMFQVLTSATGDAEAKTAYGDAIASFTKCPGEDGTTLSVTDLSFPKVGDQSQAFRITATPSSSSSPSDDDLSFPVSIDAVIVRDGRLVELYVFFALLSGSPTAFQPFVTKGVARAHVLS